MRALAFGATVGVSPRDLLRADPLERRVLLAVVDKAIELQDDRDRALANRIVNGVVEAWNRGRKRG